jgi:hypothetical protein
MAYVEEDPVLEAKRKRPIPMVASGIGGGPGNPGPAGIVPVLIIGAILLLWPQKAY